MAQTGRNPGLRIAAGPLDCLIHTVPRKLDLAFSFGTRPHSCINAVISMVTDG
jgi:hypothetical protein